MTFYFCSPLQIYAFIFLLSVCTTKKKIKADLQKIPYLPRRCHWSVSFCCPRFPLMFAYQLAASQTCLVIPPLLTFILSCASAMLMLIQQSLLSSQCYSTSISTHPPPFHPRTFKFHPSTPPLLLSAALALSSPFFPHSLTHSGSLHPPLPLTCVE